MTQPTETKLTKRAEAMLAAAILAVRADRKILDAEIARLRSMLFLNPAFGEIENADESILAVSRVYGEMKEDEALAAIVPALDAPGRETAYAWAVQMAHADGVVEGVEHAFLSKLREKLGIHGELAGKIKAVVGILNRA